MAWGGLFIAALISAAPQPAACMATTRAIPAGGTVSRSDFTPAACTEAPATLRYDARLKAARAGRALEAGETVAALPGFALPAVRSGETLHVRTQIGPVVVDREVVALQPGQPGGRIFVRTADGEVFAAVLAEDGR